MSRNALPFGLLSLALTLAACQQAPTPQAANLSTQALGGAQRQVVVFKAGTLPADASERVSKAGGRVVRSLKEIGVVIALGNETFTNRMRGDSAVLSAGKEHMYTLPQVQEVVAAPELAAQSADFGYAYQWDMRRIGAQEAALRVGAAQANVKVAVLDTGVMTDHPDLAGQVVSTTGTNYCQETGADGTTGYPVYSKLIDFDAYPNWEPGLGCTPANATYEAHGTHVAGTVAGKAGGGAIIGVAPGARIMGYKVFDRYRYTDETGRVVDAVGGFDGPIFSAIIDAAQNGAAAINMSLGSTLDRSSKSDNASWLAWQRVMNYADKMGTLIIAAAGNAALNTNGNLANIPSDVPGVMSVTASGVASLGANSAGQLVANGPDVLAFYSNYGASSDIAAPGGDCGLNPANNLSWCAAVNRPTRPANWYDHLILSSVIDEATGRPGYDWYAGTSMAAPHVAGVAALVKAQHPEYSANQLKAHLKRTAEQVGQKQTFGSGLLSADLATR